MIMLFIITPDGVIIFVLSYRKPPLNSFSYTFHYYIMRYRGWGLKTK